MKASSNGLLVLFIVALLSACGEGDNTQVESAAQSDQEVASDHTAVAADEQAPALIPLTGEQLFIACQGCHTLHQGEPHLLGPNLYGFMGAPAATRPDYHYSAALSEAGLSWDRATLTAWIVATQNLVPNTLMSYHNVIAVNELPLLIDYLEKETTDAL